MKIIVRSAAVLGAVASLALATASAQAQASPARIVAVEGCSASPAQQAMHFVSIFGTGVDQPGVPAMLMIAFENRAAKPLSSVDFGLVQDGKVLAVVRDVGRFTSSALVMHAYGLGEDRVPRSDRPVSCVPLTAIYTDGSTWMNAKMPAH